MTRFSTFAASVGLMLVLSSFAQAGDQAAPNSETKKPAIQVIPVTIHPAALPAPTLKYHLLPTALERSPGNAATLYARAFAAILVSHHWNDAERHDKADLDLMRQWLETPLESLPRDQVWQTLGGFSGAMSQAEQAVRREQCDWGMPLHEGSYFEVLLPEAQEFRSFSHLFALKTRALTAQKQYGDAVESLKAGYGLARDIAEQPFLVSGLVGLSIVGTMSNQLLTLCQQPEAPNLYWSITTLPHPIVDLQKSIRTEYDGLYLEFPQLQEVRRSQYAPDQWNLVLRQIVPRLIELPRMVGATPDFASADAAAVVDRLLAAAPKAKADLVAAGYSQKDLDAMSPAQIVLLHIVETYDALRDQSFQLIGLPYWQAQGRLEALESELKSAKTRELIPVASVLLRGVTGVNYALARTERELAALRCIEALRLYAAGHEGNLPTTLDEITEVPIPLNPVTGKPFEYHLDGATAILEASGGPASAPRPQYQVKVAK